VAYEMLIHGDCATATELDGGQCGGFGCVDGCIDCISTQLIADDPPGEDSPLGPDEGDTLPAALPMCPACLTCEYPMSSLIPDLCIVCSNARFFGLHDRFAASRIAQAQQPHAVTLTSIIIDQAVQRNRICANCQGAHLTWQCPEVAQRLDVPMSDIDRGGALCGMLWCDPAGFVRLLERSTDARRAEYAESYLAFLRDAGKGRNLTASQVLARWLPAPAMYQQAA
jgi:hypothetical protein